MSGFDNGLTISYGWTHDFGAGNRGTSIRRPGLHPTKPGKGYSTCRIEAIHVSASETFTATTTQGFVRIGITGSIAKFAQLAMGTLANTDSRGTFDDIDAIIQKVIDMDIEDIDQLEVTFIAPTGGTPAGIGEVTIVLTWF